MTDLSMPNPLAPYLLWIRLGFAAMALAALVALGWRVHAWKQAYEALPAAQEALAAEVACQAPSKCAERVAGLVARQAAVSKQSELDYARELAQLRDRPVRTRTVRLCPEAAAGDVRHPAAPGAADGAGPAAGLVPGSPGRDIGPELYQLAGDADQVAARLRALQDYNRALSSTGK